VAVLARFNCSISIASNNARKFPSPKPVDCDRRSISSKKK
jgi:hypothetical protein